MGLEGIGKTALATQFVDQNHIRYKHIVWVSVNSDDENNASGNSIEAIANDSVLIKKLGLEMDPRLPAASKAKLILSELNDYGGVNLLVLDNVGPSLMEILDALPKKPNWHVLVTSRERLKPFKLIEVEELTMEEAEIFFHELYPAGKNQKDLVLALLNKIGKHTLTLELFANTCEEYEHINPAFILKTLEEGNFEKISEEVYNGRSKREVEIYSYLMAILSISKLNENEQKQALWMVCYAFYSN